MNGRRTFFVRFEFSNDLCISRSYTYYIILYRLVVPHSYNRNLPGRRLYYIILLLLYGRLATLFHYCLRSHVLYIFVYVVYSWHQSHFHAKRAVFARRSSFLVCHFDDRARYNEQYTIICAPIVFLSDYVRAFLCTSTRVMYYVTYTRTYVRQ